LHSRLARGGLADLFRELRTARGDELQAALARTLGDPDLAVAYRVPHGFATADGAPLSLPADRAVLPIRLADREVAALVYDPALDDDPALVEAAGAAATIALESDQLHAESQARLVELQQSRERIVEAGDTERRRLERDLHDGAQQGLLALALQLDLIQADIRSDPSSAEARVSSASDALAESLEELRELARGLHPALLEHGLAAALTSLASRSPVPTAVSCNPLGPVPRPVELALYFVASESLANVAKHASATTASLRLTGTPGGVAIEIADDGAGGADAGGGSGLRGLADRVEALGGHLLVTSPRGSGTVITAELPCAS
jgi:signal transduction histidine kinase